MSQVMPGLGREPNLFRSAPQTDAALGGRVQREVPVGPKKKAHRRRSKRASNIIEQKALSPAAIS